MKIKNNENAEAVLMTRSLSLLGYVAGLFQDHGRKPLSERATRIRDFVRAEMRLKNPHDSKDHESSCAHQYYLVEMMGEEPLEDATVEEIAYEIRDGGYSGELTETAVTHTNRLLTDELCCCPRRPIRASSDKGQRGGGR